MYSSDATEFFLERAAIMEVDGGLDRADAQFAAVALTRIYCERTGAELPKLAYFEAMKRGAIVWSDAEGRAFAVDDKEKR